MTAAVGGLGMEPDPDAVAVGPCEGCGDRRAATYRFWSSDRIDFGPWRLCPWCAALVGRKE